MFKEQDKVFQEKLQMGTSAEDIVYSFLIRENSFVQDLRQQKHGEHAGPRLKGTEGELVLPDFAVYNKNPNKGKFAIDAKYKNSIYTVKGKDCFTVDDKYEDYKLATQVLGLDFLMIAFLYKDKLYFYKESDCIGTHQFKPNKFGNGLVYLFEFDANKHTY